MKKIILIAVSIAAALIIGVVVTSVAIKPSGDPTTPSTEYTVTFDYNYDGAPEPTPAQTVNGKVSAPTPAPTRTDGYTFENWYDAKEGGNVFDFNTTITAAKTLYAHWTYNGATPPPVQKYTVTFDLNKEGATGGPAPITNVESGSTVERPTEIPQAKDFTFDDWYKAAEGTDKWDFDTDVVTQNTTIYAHWTDNGVTPPQPGNYQDVTLIVDQIENIDQYIAECAGADTGTSDDDVDAAEHTLYNDTYTQIIANAGVRYNSSTQDFDGVKSTVRLQTRGSGSATSKSIKLVLASNAVIKVYARSSSKTPADRQFGLYNSDYEIITQSPVPTAQEQHIYEYSVSAAGTYYLGGTNGFDIYAISIDYDSTVTPPQPAQEYTVTFHYNYSGANPATTTATTVNGIVAEPTKPTRTDGYTFDAWYTQAENGDKFVFSTKLTQNTDLYAHWIKDEPAQEYTVTFDYNYDSKGAYQTAQTVNGKVTAPAENPKRDGYTFEGWYEETECENRFNFSTTITAAKTLYANWTKNAEAGENVTVTFQTNGGSTVDNQTFTAGGAATKPSTDPTYGENVFCGWYSDPDCTQEYNFGDPVNANITIYALWKHWVSKESMNFGTAFSQATGTTDDRNRKSLTEDYKYSDSITIPATMRLDGGTTLNTQGKPVPIVLTLSGENLFEIYIHGAGASTNNKAYLTFMTENNISGTPISKSTEAASKEAITWTVTKLEAGTYYIFTSGSVAIDQFVIRELVPLDQSGNPGGEQGGGGQELTTVTVTFESAGGTQILPLVIKKDQLPATIDAPDPAPTRFGFTFKGWFTELENGREWNFDSDQVTQSITLYAHWEKDDSVNTDTTELYTVTFMVDGSVHNEQKVENGQRVTKPTDPSKDGAQFVGWYKDDQTQFDFNSFITENLTLTAKFETLDAKIIETGAYNESLYVIWQDANPATSKVEYKLESASDWTQVDAPLIRAYGSNARVDIVGLKAGNYNVRVTPSGAASAIELPGTLAVAAYDRSGYAHFNYHDGIGAYNDDGTLKEGTLVIYVTDQNKNDILDYAYVNGQKVDISKYMVTTQTALEGGVTVGQQTSIGALLNNRRYSGNDRWDVGISKLCEVYGSVAIRIVGKVSAERENSMVSDIDGLTTWNSKENGGSLGDNGRMARMVNAHDLTIEGIGNDASIYGWGIHFISSVYSGKTARMGTSFEVRNITFDRYPEDAVGMEGEQESSGLTSPVERCWIHNNTFLPGYAYQYAGKESDKTEGDGSCDFKRGMYYTLAYNYFEYCHKTNLIGSSDDSYQFNITMHHNWWNNCGSRVPLSRQANIHFYNNYVSADQNDSRAKLSYVMSIRANAYIFAEANYFDGCKNITQLKTGAVKSLNNVVYANEGENKMTEVSDRSEPVSNSCKYLTTDYSKFDTDEKLFYYDKVNNVSSCLLDDAATARQRVIMFAGANEHGKDYNTAMNLYTPNGALVIPDNGNLTITIGTNQQGIVFNGVSNQGKFKGQGITFTLSAEAALTITTSTTGEPAPELLSSDGRVYAHKFVGTRQIVLPAGTYIVASGQKDKEAVITAMTFENTAASSKARIDAAKAAIEKLPEDAANVQLSTAADIKAARTAYNSLTATERKTFDEQNAALVKRLTDCEAKLSELQVENVRSLIKAIGEVTANSYPKIEAAQNAYNALNATQQAQLTEEKAILDKAVADFAQYAVQSLIKSIQEWKSKVDGVTATDRTQVEALIKEGESLESLYDGLNSGEDGGTNEQEKVTNYGDLTAGMAKLAEYQNVFVFEDALDAFESTTVTSADSSKVSELKKAYEALTTEQQGALAPEKTQKYNEIIANYNKLLEAQIKITFDGGKSSNTDFIETTGNATNKKSLTVNGELYESGMKIESSTKITVKLTKKAKITLYFDSSTNIYYKLSTEQEDSKIASSNAVSAPEGGFKLELTLEANTYNFMKGGSTNLFLAIIEFVD